jgi:copper chaperone CopZ
VKLKSQLLAKNCKKIVMVKIFIVLSITLSSLVSQAQIAEARLQAVGLTCAMCSKSVHKALEKLDFVDKITVDLKKVIFNVTFKPNASVNPDAMEKAVKEAGFSVGLLQLNIPFDSTEIQNDKHLTMGELNWHFVKVNKQQLTSSQWVTLAEKKFMTPKLFKKYKDASAMECFKTGTMLSCCTTKPNTASNRIYHITL